MTLQEIWNAMLYRRQGNTTADTNFQAMVTTWANECLKDFWMGKGLPYSPLWWFLEVSYSFPTVTDQMTYDLPSTIDGNKVFSLRQKTDDVKLKFITQRELDYYAADPDDEGGSNPLFYTIYGRDGTTKNPYVRLFPIPSSVITIYMRYYTTMDQFDNANSSSTVKLPDKYKSVLIDGIVAKWFEFAPERGQYQVKLQEFTEGIRKANEDNTPIDEDRVAKDHGEVFYPYPRFDYPVGL